MGREQPPQLLMAESYAQPAGAALGAWRPAIAIGSSGVGGPARHSSE